MSVDMVLRTRNRPGRMGRSAMGFFEKGMCDVGLA
jgi:hypothetical protein